jgi:hypothetical protein
MPLLKKGEALILEEPGASLGAITKGTAILTNRRIIFEGKTGSFLDKRVETLLDLPLGEIKNLQVKKGFLKGKGVVLEAPMTYVSSTLKGAFDLTPGQLFQIALNVKDPDKWGNEIQRAISEQE